MIGEELQETARALFVGAKTATLAETCRTDRDGTESEVAAMVDENEWKREEENWSGRVDLNHEGQKTSKGRPRAKLVSTRKKP